MSNDSFTRKPKEDMTPAERQAHKQAKRARKAANAEAVAAAAVEGPVAGPSTLPADAEVTSKSGKKEKKRKRTAPGPDPTPDSDPTSSAPDSVLPRANVKSPSATEPVPQPIVDLTTGTAEVPDKQKGMDKESRKRRRKQEKQEKADAKRLRKAAAKEGDPPVEDKAGVAEEIDTDEEPRHQNPQAADLWTDPTLSDAARQAIDYVNQFRLSRLPAAGPAVPWKFNKTRQAWLMKRIWTADIPEQYEGPALEYLKTVQSGARKGLIDMAKQYLLAPLAPTVPPPAIATESAEAGVESKADGNEAKAEGDETAKGRVAPATPDETAKLAELRRRRAQQLLKLMGAR